MSAFHKALRSTRLWAAIGAVLATAALSPKAHAVDLMGGDIKIELELPDGNGNYVRSSAQDVLNFFDLAECVCNQKFAVRLTLEKAPASLPTTPAEVWVGSNCDDFQDPNRDQKCTKITTIRDIQSLRSPQTIPIPTADLMYPNSASCDFQEDKHWVYVLIDDDKSNNQPENVFQQGIFYDTLPPPAPVAPSARGGENAVEATWTTPTSRDKDIWYYQLLCARADGTTNAADKFPRADPEYKTALMVCNVDDGTHPTPVGGGVGPDAGGVSLVDAGASAAPDAAAGPTVDAGATPDAGAGSSLPGGLDNLTAMSVCGTASSTDTSLRVNGLTNGVPYRLVLASVDHSRNVTAVDLGTVTPKPVTDFWEDYKNRGGHADGGFCFVATASYGNYNHPYVIVLRAFRDQVLARHALGRDFIHWYYTNSPPLAQYIARHPIARALSGGALFPLVVVAGFWVYTGPWGKLGALIALVLLILLRRRIRDRHRAETLADPDAHAPRPHRRLKIAIALVVAFAAAVAWTRIAAAQSYWQQLNRPVAPAGPAKIKWTVELKFGPYTPQVDSEFQLSKGQKGPFEQMYGGGPFLMSTVELDRYFLWPGGELGVAGDLGYLSTSADAYKTDSNGNVLMQNGQPVRSQGDTTTFRLLPTALSAVYRYTQLDERWGVPLVPYAKLGLAYYIWWITKPDGSISSVGNDKARGGSLGWQASAGLSLRAERLDPGAALSLRNELGIQHAGFFAEGTYAKVDGLGINNRLHVGDLTWYAGINFEF